MAKAKDPFFVGWGKIPKNLVGFLVRISAVFVAAFACAAYVISSTQSDPGDGAFMGRATAVGVLQVGPYPVLHVISSDRYKPGTAILLSGNGKRGTVPQSAGLDGQVVRVDGAMMRRGDLNGMQLRRGENGLRPDENLRSDGAITIQPLGRWRLTGEICDGKCLNGAMRPGRGLAHKACANLCLLGGVPPVFVSSSPVQGSTFLLLADQNGAAVTQHILDHTATYIDVEGEIERRGELLIFKIAPDTIRLAK